MRRAVIDNLTGLAEIKGDSINRLGASSSRSSAGQRAFRA
jgi:hypothetical protein